jgi:uncharacterized protein (DUF2141 family)
MSIDTFHEFSAANDEIHILTNMLAGSNPVETDQSRTIVLHKYFDEETLMKTRTATTPLANPRIVKHGLIFWHIAISCIGIFGGTAIASASQDITVTIKGSDHGEIFASLFTESTDPDIHFTDTDAIRRWRGQPNADGTISFVISDIDGGSYAIAAFQDEDGDGALSRNIVGMPAEKYGFSNHARGYFGPPDFKDAVFQIENNHATAPLVIELK